MKDEVVKLVLEELRKGGGAEVKISLSPTKSFRVVFIPAPLYSSNHQELLIACEGRGVHFYNGQQPLNQFSLISSGFPIDLAREVSVLVGHIMKQGRELGPALAENKPLQLTGSEEPSKG